MAMLASAAMPPADSEADSTLRTQSRSAARHCGALVTPGLSAPSCRLSAAASGSSHTESTSGGITRSTARRASAPPRECEWIERRSGTMQRVRASSVVIVGRCSRNALASAPTKASRTDSSQSESGPVAKRTIGWSTGRSSDGCCAVAWAMSRTAARAPALARPSRAAKRSSRESRHSVSGRRPTPERICRERASAACATRDATPSSSQRASRPGSIIGEGRGPPLCGGETEGRARNGR
eukprot:scaffold230407_cov30-Tisochrysis_lutea.AAC.3